MERLCEEYVALLTSDKPASDKFWELEERIKADRKSPGVIVQMSRSQMQFTLVNLVLSEVISMKDLEDFSDDTKERVEFMVERW